MHMFFFFFSSRRRHTRWTGDGVQTGALPIFAAEIEVESAIEYAEIPGFPLSTVESQRGRLLCGTFGGKVVIAMQGRFHRYERSEERRVGKECRARWSREHEEKKGSCMTNGWW